MPVPRPRSGDGLIDQLNASAPTRAANNALPISAYYRGCDLLLSQAKVYRSSRNEEQLYVMLMRFASLVIETIPKHAQFSKEAPQYLRFSQQVKAVMAELEQLKLSLQLRNVKPAARSSNRPADAALLVTSNLPGIDWASVGAGTGAGAAAATDSRFGAEAAEWLARYSGASAAGPPPAALRSPGSFGGSGGGSYSYGGGGGAAAAAPSAPPPPPAYQAAYVPASQQALEKHSLFGPRAPPRGGAAAAPQPPRPRYPDFDRSPAASIDLLWSPGGGAAASSQQDGGAPSAPPEEALAALELAERRASAGSGGGSSLLDGALPRPSAGPGLGPQELAVHSMDAAAGRPGGTCAHPAAAPGGGGAVVSSGGVRPLEKRIELRDIHISVALMNDFLHYASTNTRRGIESCGILAGTLSAGDSIFCVTTLIIPKQEGTSDTVAALNEEEIYEAQASRELYPLGWIHTHPTQTCFLSSVDVHTQCGYQTMLEEAVAIVMAPTDSRNKCGIFRLTTPGGLSLIQKCALRGFHTHPPTATGQEVYELCGHVYLNPRTRHEVLDLR